MAELTAQGPSSDTPECCPVPCPAQPLGAAAQGETWGSIAQCLNHRASALECLYLREQGFDRSDRFICIDPSCCSLPGSQLSAEITQYKAWQHWPQTDVTAVSLHGPLCQLKNLQMQFSSPACKLEL